MGDWTPIVPDRPTVELVLLQTSPTCVSYRLVDDQGQVVWSNRVAPTPSGDMGALTRMREWARRNGYRVVGPRKHGAAQAQAPEG